jgi:hypothetical protein
MTMAFSGAGRPAPAAPGMTVPPSPKGPSTQDVLAKFAKPQPAKTEPPKKPKGRGRSFLVIITSAALALGGAAWFFLFRDTKSLKTAVSMDSGRPPVGGEISDEGAAPARKPGMFAPRSSAQPGTAAPAPAPTAAPMLPASGQPGPQSFPEESPAAPSPAATPAPAAPSAASRDERPAAIDLVKDFPLDDERGTVGAWLQYSYAASPGAANTEKWDAGAVEESTYLVQYTVQPADQKIREAITYLFEADVERRIVRGKNPAAKELLSGGGARPRAKAKPAKPAKTRKKAVRKRPVPEAPKEVPLAPLPTDAELAPPADEDSSFHSDTVQPNL